MKDPAVKYFAKGTTERERAAFEGGIALAALYHQFVGTPISGADLKAVRALEKAMEQTAKLQPFREDVKVKVNTKTPKERASPYDYETLMGDHLDVTVNIRYGKAKATARLRYIPELDYPLMYIEEIGEEL
ncbi:MAG: dihydroneopterin aldolase family protein [Candidatus Bathyarchaeia archaeon]